MKLKKFLILVSCIMIYNQTIISSENKQDSQDILDKLSSINKMDTQNSTVVADNSFNLLFNNFVQLKNFIVQNFTKNKFEKLCLTFIDQIYPVDEKSIVDFGKPAPVTSTPTSTSTPTITNNETDLHTASSTESESSTNNSEHQENSITLSDTQEQPIENQNQPENTDNKTETSDNQNSVQDTEEESHTEEEAITEEA